MEISIDANVFITGFALMLSVGVETIQHDSCGKIPFECTHSPG